MLNLSKECVYIQCEVRIIDTQCIVIINYFIKMENPSQLSLFSLTESLVSQCGWHLGKNYVSI